MVLCVSGISSTPSNVNDGSDIVLSPLNLDVDDEGLQNIMNDSDWILDANLPVSVQSNTTTTDQSKSAAVRSLVAEFDAVNKRVVVLKNIPKQLTNCSR